VFYEAASSVNSGFCVFFTRFCGLSRASFVKSTQWVVGGGGVGGGSGGGPGGTKSGPTGTENRSQNRQKTKTHRGGTDCLSSFSPHFCGRNAYKKIRAKSKPNPDQILTKIQTTTQTKNPDHIPDSLPTTPHPTTHPTTTHPQARFQTPLQTRFSAIGKCPRKRAPWAS